MNWHTKKNATRRSGELATFFIECFHPMSAFLRRTLRIKYAQPFTAVTRFNPKALWKEVPLTLQTSVCIRQDYSVRHGAKDSNSLLLLAFANPAFILNTDGKFVQPHKTITFITAVWLSAISGTLHFLLILNNKVKFITRLYNLLYHNERNITIWMPHK